MSQASFLRRVLRRLTLGLVAVVLVALLAAWYALADGRARLRGDLTTPALAAPVAVERDALGSVTLTADSRDDLTWALGFVHAQERFFEMDLMRRLPAGELAELIGPSALEADLDHRRHRLRAMVGQAYAELPADQRRTLDRYRDGVNAGLDDLHSRPWAYYLLRSTPRPWRSEDTLLVMASMYLDLNGDGHNQRERRLAELRAVLPAPLVDFLTAPDPAWEAPLDGALSPPPAPPAASVFDLRRQASPTPTPARSTLTAALAPALDDRRAGSNNFAVAGALTGTGAAMLENDMHLGLRVPDIWFRARLRYADPTAPNGRRDAVGVTLPGTPALVAGSNGQLAWGFTNSFGDWLDWVRIRRDPADASRYAVPEGWANIERHVELIHVRGQADRSLIVETTRWGPIMATDTDGTPLALAWIGDLPRGYNLGLMALEHAASVAQAVALAPTFGMPPQNLLAADAGGHIGWTVTGTSLPQRTGYDPTLPADWSRPGVGWQGWTAPADYPRLLDPPDGRLWTANQRTVGGAWLALLGSGGHDLGARAQQIRDDLRAQNRFTTDNLLAIALDDRALFLARWQRLLQDTLAGTRDPALTELRELTATWRGRAAVDSVDYRLVRAFREAVHSAVLAPFVTRVKARYPDFAWPPGASAEAAVWTLLRDRPAWLLDPAYADWDALLQAAARRVTDELGRQPGGLPARRWGEVNHAGIRHALSPALPAFIARLLDMPDQPLPGDANMPRVAAPAFGASERLVVSPGHEAQGILEMPGGQSDHPLSPFYGAGHADWVDGRPTPLLPGPTRYRFTLSPTPLPR